MKKNTIAVFLLLSVLISCNSVNSLPAAHNESILKGREQITSSDVAQPATITVAKIPTTHKPYIDSGIPAAGEISLPDWDSGSEVTPYQFLYLLCGNAEELSFSYTVTNPSIARSEAHTFQRMGDTSVACFTAGDMNGNTVSVRELEKGGKVHYIMDDTKVIKTFLAPAEDFLLYQMITAAKTSPDSALSQDDYLVFEHNLSFEQDESIQIHYQFFMKDGVLRKLVVYSANTDKTTYEFSEFYQGITDPTAFNYPQDYAEEIFNNTYTGEHMPPWWDNHNQ